MPLSINVGLSRKSSENYNSSGCSINVTAELDQALLARPAELQSQIAALYGQAESALARQADQAPAQPQPRRTAPAGRNGDARPVPATASQQRAIQAICRRLGTDPDFEAQQLVGMSFAELTVKQASQLIDGLKAAESAPAGRNGGGR